MTLSPFFFLSQKSDRKDFLFICRLIEIFKRDYFYPIFAEIYRRKGFLAVADLLDLFSKKTNQNLLFLERMSLLISNNSGFSPEGGNSTLLLTETSIQMRYLLDLSIQEAISPRTNFYDINKVFLNCLRFNSEHFYPSLMSYWSTVIKNSDESLIINGGEFLPLLTSIVELETKNFRLLEKKLYF